MKVCAGVSVGYLPELLLVSCGEFPHLLLPTLFLFSEHGLHLLNLSVVGVHKHRSGRWEGSVHVYEEYCMARKFDGELNLAVKAETTKLKSENIFACNA